MAAPIYGGPPGGNAVQHGSNEGPLIHQQGGVSNEHPRRGRQTTKPLFEVPHVIITKRLLGDTLLKGGLYGFFMWVYVIKCIMTAVIIVMLLSCRQSRQTLHERMNLFETA